MIVRGQNDLSLERVIYSPYSHASFLAPLNWQQKHPFHLSSCFVSSRAKNIARIPFVLGGDAVFLLGGYILGDDKVCPDCGREERV